MHAKLNEFLVRNAEEGKQFVLIVDEAQNLNDEVLETIRLLSDFETPRRKLMQIILAGQPQLGEKLSQPNLVQLRQRISLISRLKPLLPQEVRHYIDYRLQVATYRGGRLFTPQALDLIAQYSQGIPRNINNICFGALSYGFASRIRMIDAEVIREVAAERDLGTKETVAVSVRTPAAESYDTAECSCPPHPSAPQSASLTSLPRSAPQAPIVAPLESCPPEMEPGAPLSNVAVPHVVLSQLTAMVASHRTRAAIWAAAATAVLILAGGLVLFPKLLRQLRNSPVPAQPSLSMAVPSTGTYSSSAPSTPSPLVTSPVTVRPAVEATPKSWLD